MNNDLPSTRQKTKERARTDRLIALLVVILPAIAAVAAVPVLLIYGISRSDFLIATVMYVITAAGLGVGYHRLLTHQSFKCGPRLRSVLCIAGSLSLQGPAIRWVADHRRHHAFADGPGDPHSPHGPDEAGFFAPVRSLWWAHVGWLFDTNKTTVRKFASDLLADPLVVRLDRLYPVWIFATLAIPFLAGWAFAGSLDGALSGLFWGGLVRIAVLHQLTWCVNSIGHSFFGAQPFATRDQSRNIWPLGVLILGEGWHNNHHAFPDSAFHGLRPSQIDINGRIIRLLEWAGLAWDVRRVGANRMELKKAVPGACRNTSKKRRG